MKSTIIFFMLLLSVNSLKSQSGFSIGIAPAFTFNFNTPTKESQLNNFKIVSDYPGFQTGVSFIFYNKHLSVIPGISYQWNKYGWRYVYSKDTKTGSIYDLDEVILSTESLSVDLMLSFFITPFYHKKATLYYNMGGGYSFIKHTQLYGHYKISIHNSSFTKILNYNQADVGSNSKSPFLKGGVSVQTSIKKVGQIRYGMDYTYYLTVLPEMSVNLEINNEFFTSSFKTRHSYLSIYLIYYFLNFEKRQKHDRFHKLSY